MFPDQAREILTTTVRRLGEALVEAEEQLREDEHHMCGSYLKPPRPRFDQLWTEFRKITTNPKNHEKN